MQQQHRLGAIGEIGAPHDLIAGQVESRVAAQLTELTPELSKLNRE
jgi:hypothetical protein